MEVLQARIDSFKKPKRVKNPKKQSSTITVRWPHPLNFKANPETLGAAGFFYNPSYDGPDSVTCYFCDKELEGWEEVDDPHVIHWEKCGQTCCWAIVRCGLLNDMDKSSRFVFTDKTRVPTHKLMEKARFDTFDVGNGWIHDQVKNHSANSKMMARAGFVYTPQQSNDDLVTCLYCDTSLSGWDAGDDPMEEHRRRKRSCPFFSASEPATRKSSRPKAKASKGHEVPPKPSRTRSKTKVSESEPEEEPTTIRVKARSTSRTTSRLEPLEETEPEFAPIDSKEAPAQSQHQSQTAAHTLTEAKVFESEPEEESTTVRVKPRSTSRTTSRLEPLEESEPVAPRASKEAPTQLQHQSQTAAHTLTEAKVFESEPEEEPTTIRVKPISTSRTISRLEHLEESEPEAAPIASKEAPTQLQHQSQTAAHTLTEAELDMTVEEWIRYQMDVEYDKFRRDGERELLRFRNQAEEVRKAIEGL